MRLFSPCLIILGYCLIALLYAPMLHSFTPLEQQHDPVIIMFYKDSCPYSRYMLPIMAEIKKRYDGRLAVINVNIGHNPAWYKNTYHFKTTPTIIYFNQGKEIMRHGSNSKTMTTAQMIKNVTALWNI